MSQSVTSYGYSNARVKAMESRLLDRSFIDSIAKTENVGSAIGLLLQTDYREYLEEFGGVNVSEGLIDFALSKSFERSTQKLIRITPSEVRDLIIEVSSKSDAQNIKLVFYAKINGKRFDEISRYIIESQSIDSEAVKRALLEPTIEEAASRLIVRSPYRKIIYDAVESYKKTSNITEVNAAIDRGFFRLLGVAINRLVKVSPESATVARLDIEMRNILTLLRAKKYGMHIEKVNDLLIEGGTSTVESLLELFENTKDAHELAERVKSFDLKHALDVFEKGKERQMLIFEISMRNQIFGKAISLLRHSTLSFAVIMGYFYLKEIEVFTLRILINSKSYALTNEEISEMIAWRI